MNELTLEANVENIARVTDFVNELLEQAECPMKAQMQIDIAIDELFGNIALYAYAPNVGQATVRVEIQPNEAKITFMDHGVPFNPLEKKNPDPTASAEERPIGGLGIFMVRKTMDGIFYRHEGGQNILTILKRLGNAQTH